MVSLLRIISQFRYLLLVLAFLFLNTYNLEALGPAGRPHGTKQQSNMNPPTTLGHSSPYLSPLITSAAFSATAYMVACKFAAGITGSTLASTTLNLLTP